jgi:hypothetical protein
MYNDNVLSCIVDKYACTIHQHKRRHGTHANKHIPCTESYDKNAHTHTTVQKLYDKVEHYKMISFC